MAIAKNTAKAAEKPEVKSAAKSVAKPAAKAAEKPAAKVVKAPAKSAAKAPVKAPVKAEAPVAAKVDVAAKVSRKELAVTVRSIIHATGAAVSSKIAETLVVAYEEAIAQHLAAGSEINLPGFGKFVSIHKEAGEKRNPSTGEMVMIAAHNVPRFKAGSKLKAACNGGAEVGDEE